MFKKFFRIFFGLPIKESSLTPKIRRVKELNNSQHDMVSETTSPKFLNKIVITITWFLMFASLISLIAIIIFAFIEKKYPPEISHVLSVTIGYFGGLITSFVRFTMNGNK